MFSTPLTSCSIGVATFSATSSALAPGKLAVTLIVGGTTSGYCAMGSLTSATTPTITMTIDSTLAKMGRSMKKRESMDSPFQDVDQGDRGASQGMDRVVFRGDDSPMACAAGSPLGVISRPPDAAAFCLPWD